MLAALVAELVPLTIELVLDELYEPCTFVVPCRASRPARPVRERPIRGSQSFQDRPSWASLRATNRA